MKRINYYQVKSDILTISEEEEMFLSELNDIFNDCKKEECENCLKEKVYNYSKNKDIYVEISETKINLVNESEDLLQKRKLEMKKDNENRCTLLLTTYLKTENKE